MVLKSLQPEPSPKAEPSPGRRRIVTAGGGAHRLAQLFMDSLTVEVVPFKEMESLVSGLTFLHEHKPDKEVFKIQPDGTQEFVPWPDPLYPCIVVNIGSGVLANTVQHEPLTKHAYILVSLIIIYNHNFGRKRSAIFTIHT